MKIRDVTCHIIPQTFSDFLFLAPSKPRLANFRVNLSSSLEIYLHLYERTRCIPSDMWLKLLRDDSNTYNIRILPYKAPIALSRNRKIAK